MANKEDLSVEFLKSIEQMMCLPSRFGMFSLIQEYMSQENTEIIPFVVELIKQAMEEGNTQRLINDERGDMITLFREKKLYMPTDELCQGLIDAK